MKSACVKILVVMFLILGSFSYGQFNPDQAFEEKLEREMTEGWEWNSGEIELSGNIDEDWKRSLWMETIEMTAHMRTIATEADSKVEFNGKNMKITFYIIVVNRMNINEKFMLNIEYDLVFTEDEKYILYYKVGTKGQDGHSITEEAIKNTLVRSSQYRQVNSDVIKRLGDPVNFSSYCIRRMNFEGLPYVGANQDEVLSAFGRPNEINRMVGVESWTYEIRGATEWDITFMTIFFDIDGVVTDYNKI